MRTYDTSFLAALQGARDQGIAPVWFFWVKPKDRTTGAEVPMGFWSGDEDLTLTTPLPGGGNESRLYMGGCNLAIEGLQYVGDLTDNPVTVTLSQIADAAQGLARGTDPRLAHVEIHAASMIGGAFVSAPQLQWVGIVDEGPISTPSYGSDGGISFSVRSELMVQLTATNPAKSSDAHQKRRAAGDRFSEYASTIGSRNVQWYKKG